MVWASTLSGPLRVVLLLTSDHVIALQPVRVPPHEIGGQNRNFRFTVSSRELYRDPNQLQVGLH